ncbi:unnamed protein product [marine sediment metagenome]|uniref:Polymerase beta nucleotidyltransferase domain-containing protein n=1 Tax=marine sediment metagenome TaxID=412755 RepID=X1K793_9ZZZZ
MQTIKILEKDNVKTVSDKKKEALEYFMQMAIKELKPWLVKAILFGSYGMRKARDDADIDILMVYYDEGERFLAYDEKEVISKTTYSFASCCRAHALRNLNRSSSCCPKS